MQKGNKKHVQDFVGKPQQSGHVGDQSAEGKR